MPERVPGFWPLGEVIETLQGVIGPSDAPGSARFDDSRQRQLLNRISQLSPGEQDVTIAHLAKLLIRRYGSAKRVLDALSVRADDPTVTECRARALMSLLPHGRELDPAPAPLSRISCSSEADRVQMAVRFLEEHASGPVSLEQVADHVGWSKWHCARVFKRHTGSGIAQFCRGVRLKRAKRLLAESMMSVKEVAAASGFTHPSDLTRCFLRAYGVSPTRFRSTFAQGFGPARRTKSQQKATY